MLTLRFALRQLRKSPATAVTVIATLALCIGANTAIYSIVDALFFRALPFPQPDRLALLTTSQEKGGASETNTSQTGAQWETIRDQATFLDPAVYGLTSGVNLVAGNRVEYVQNQRVSANFFHVLGIAPLLGREFSRQQDTPNGPALVILSYPLWQRIFHGNPAILGQTVDLRGTPHTVVGIMPQGFRDVLSGDTPSDLWTPLHPSTTGEGSGDNYGVIARLKPGVTLAQASGQANAVMRDLFSKMHLPQGITVQEKAMPFQAGITYDLHSAVYLMWGAVALVLLIGCVNIAGILLARSAVRSREFATRLALGASRRRIISELLTETFVLAFLGGLLGLIVGEFALKALLAMNPGAFAMTGPVRLSLPVITVMLLLSFAASILFGLFPALEASSVDLRSALAEDSRGSTGGPRQWRRQSLV